MPSSKKQSALREQEALDREADRAIEAASNAMMDGAPAEYDDDERRRISERAYELYLERGEREGDDLTDWLEAEREIRGRRH